MISKLKMHTASKKFCKIGLKAIRDTFCQGVVGNQGIGNGSTKFFKGGGGRESGYNLRLLEIRNFGRKGEAP